MTELPLQILSAQSKVLPRSAMGKAAKYGLALWKS